MRVLFQKSAEKENLKSTVIKETSLKKYYESYKKARLKLSKSGKRALADELDYQEFRNFYQNISTLKRNKLIDLEETVNKKLLIGEKALSKKRRLSIAQYIAYSQTQNFEGAVDAFIKGIQAYAERYPNDQDIQTWLTYTKEYIALHWAELTQAFRAKIGGDDAFDEFMSPTGETELVDGDEPGMMVGLSE